MNTKELRLRPISEQVVVVFGASSGIGRATALQFAAQGAKVVAASRQEEGLQSLLVEIYSTGGDAIAVAADTTRLEDVQNVALCAIEKYGRIDSWAHIAGVGLYGKFMDLTPEEFEQSLRVNLMGQVYGAMTALPYLRRHGGALIHVSSVEAEVGFPFQSAYAAAKHGMKGFLDVLRLELEHDTIPVSVTNIMPAVINTPFFDNARTKIGVTPRAVPPVYEPEQVANAIVDAAATPRKDVIVGSAGHMMVWSKRLMPRLLDKIMHRMAFREQLTGQHKLPESPSNLFRQETGDARIRANWDKQKAST